MNQMLDISPPDITTYIASFGVSRLQQQLLSNKKRSHLAELIGFADIIISDLPAISERSGFTEYFTKLRECKAAHILKAWATPGAYHWNAMTCQFIDVAIHHIAPSKILIDYLSIFGGEFEVGFTRHLHDIGRFLLATSLFAGRPMAFDTPLELPLPCVIPGTGVALLPEQPCDTKYVLPAVSPSLIDAFSALQSTEGGVERAILIDVAMNAARATALAGLRLPYWAGRYGTVTIDNFEPCLNLAYIEAFPRVHNLQRITRFVEVQNRAIDWLGRYDSALIDELSATVASVTMMDTSAVEAVMCSGSASAIFGACFFSVTDEPLYVAEMLLHEFCHNKLRLLQDFVDLLVPERVGSAIYYSPWRDDPRPLDGILHGLFVFSTIAHFWLFVAHDPQASAHEQVLARRRVATLRYQLDFALAEFAEHAPRTEHGEACFETLRQSIEELKIQTHDWSFHTIYPLFAGLVRTAELKHLPVVEALPRHRQLWEARYRSIA